VETTDKVEYQVKNHRKMKQMCYLLQIDELHKHGRSEREMFVMHKIWYVDVAIHVLGFFFQDTR